MIMKMMTQSAIIGLKIYNFFSLKIFAISFHCGFQFEIQRNELLISEYNAINGS